MGQHFKSVWDLCSFECMCASRYTWGETVSICASSNNIWKTHLPKLQFYSLLSGSSKWFNNHEWDSGEIQYTCRAPDCWKWPQESFIRLNLPQTCLLFFFKARMILFQTVLIFSDLDINWDAMKTELFTRKEIYLFTYLSTPKSWVHRMHGQTKLG